MVREGDKQMAVHYQAGDAGAAGEWSCWSLGKDKAQACRPSPQDQASRIFMDLPPSVGG